MQKDVHGVICLPPAFAGRPDAVAALVTSSPAVQLGIAEAGVGGDVLRRLDAEERDVASLAFLEPSIVRYAGKCLYAGLS